MKFWKKGLSLVMALGLSVSAVGCFGETSSSSSGVTLTKEVAMTNLTQTVENSKSFKVDLDCEVAVSGVMTTTVDGEIVVSLDDNGADMKATITAATDYVDAEEEDFTSSMTLYLIDDYAYNYDAQTNTYMKSTMTLSQLIEGALAETGLTATQVGAYVAQLEEILTEAGVTEEAIVSELKESATVSESVMSWSVDYKDEANTVLDFAANYDINKTLETALNEALTAMGADTNVDAILDSVGALGTLKVSEAVATVNAYLTLNYQTNLQAIWDAALVDEAVVGALLQAGMTQENINAMKAIKISDLVTEYGEMTLDDVLALVISMTQTETTTTEGGETGTGTGEGSETPTITLKSLTDMAKAYLEATKISDLNANLAQIQAGLKGLDFTALGGSVSVTYDSAASVSEIAVEAAVTMSMTMGQDVQTAGVTVGVSVSEFSANTVTVALPAGATQVTPQ